MMNTQLESQIINHLEFHGYELNLVPNIDPSWTMRMLRAEHPSGSCINIMLFENVAKFTIWIRLNDFAMTNRQELLALVNDLNHQFYTQYYIAEMDETPAFHINLVYFGPYDKKAFGHFVSTWERDRQAMWETQIGKFLA